MKKIFVYLTVLILCLLGCKNNLTYEQGKDTIQAYGDGTYQILHQKTDGQEHEILTNCKYNQCVLTEVDSYTSVDENVYFMGKYYTLKIWCKLSVNENLLLYCIEDNEKEDFTMTYLNDMQTDNQIKLLSSYEDFSENDKRIFKALE